jgi:hypothetical protein
VLNHCRGLLAVVTLFVGAASVHAQGTHEFLGAPRAVPDQFTPRHGIRYNTQGYDQPEVNWNKKLRKWKAKNVPDEIIEQIMAFPGSPDAIARWIDDAFDQTQAQFMACGGGLARRAERLSPASLLVTIMPSAFYEPFYKVNVAGAFYPDKTEIKVLNIYYTWKGENKGWLRHARELIAFEMGNYLAYTLGLQPEPRIEGWPCTAAPLPPSKP